jgi:tetratricopeptide (TPR) repeat protein
MPYRYLLVLCAVLLTSCATQKGAVHDSEEASTKYTESAEQARESDLFYQVMVGEMAGRFGALDTASQAYADAALETDDPRVAERATHVALYGRQYDLALQAAQRWEHLEPGGREVRQILATLYARQGHIDEAVEYFGVIIKETEGQAGGGYQLASALLAQDVPKENSLAVMERLVSDHLNDFNAQYSYAALAYRWKDYPRTLNAVEKALKADPKSRDARLLRDQAWLDLGETDRALDDVALMIKDKPDDLDVHLAYAQMLVKVKRYDQARTQFEYVAAKQPDNADLLYTLGLLNLEIQNYDDAASYLLQVLKQGKHVVESSYYLGRISESVGQYKEAIGWYIRVNEGQFAVEAQLRIAVMLAKLGHMDQAREHLERMREEFNSPEQQVNLYLMEGSLLEEADEYQAGIELYDQALKSYADDIDLIYARAMLYEKMDRVDLMEKDLQRILSLDPNNTTALNALGYTLADRTDRYQEALKYIQKALQERPDDPAILDSMGWVQYRLGNLEEAERYLRKANSLLDDAEVASHLSEVMWVRGQHDEAVEILQNALEKFPNSPQLQTLKRRIGQ